MEQTDLGKEQLNTHLSNFISQLQLKNDSPDSSSELKCGEPFEKTAGKDRYDDDEFLGNNAEKGSSNYDEADEKYTMPILHKMNIILEKKIESRIKEEKNKKQEKNEDLTSSADPSPSAEPSSSTSSNTTSENDLILEQIKELIKNKIK